MRQTFVVPLLTMLLAFTKLPAEENYWQQFVHYTLDVTLIPIQKKLIGQETILYKNNSPDTLYKFYMHLYPNAYRGPESIMAKEAKHFFRNVIPDDAGYLKIESLKIITDPSNDRESSLAAFRVNDTILETDLPTPLPPGGEMTFEIDFTLKIRKHTRRAGYRGNQHDFAQWYPKVCVYDESGWNAEPFHYQGEFYGEFGVFDVTIDAPYDYIIGATGEVLAGDPGWEAVQVTLDDSKTESGSTLKTSRLQLNSDAAQGKRREVTFHAENVHDFAWVASPDFIYESGEWDGIPIHVLYRSRVKNRWRRIVVERGARALEWLSKKFGRYPYPQLTIAHGLLRGGMEYPMLVMNSSESESLILHEVGHIYFFAILGNNEWKEAWLDEGFTSFQTRWYMETRYGEWGFDREAWLKRANWLQKRRPRKTSRERNRDFALQFINSGHNEPISKPAYKFNEPMSYSVNAYTKGAFFYDMLKYVVGDSVFRRICHDYFERWKFKHVNQARFQATCEHVSGQDLDWFFDQWLHDSVTVDYRLGTVKKRKNGDVWQTDVTIIRKARGKMPVEVEVTAQSGEKVVKRWDGLGKLGSLSFQTRSKPVKVVLDPEDAILDNTRLNNGALTFKLHFDYPNMSYSPRESYLVTWRPSAWTNRVDKVRFGGRLRGRYGALRNAVLGAWFGVDSQVLDLRFRYSNPLTPLGPNARGSIGVQKMEGRFEIDAHLFLSKSAYLSRPPKQRFWVGFNHSRLVGDQAQRYTVREYDQKQDTSLVTWQKGTVNNFYVRYQLESRWRFLFSNLTLGFDTVLDDWQSDYDYRSGFADARFWLTKNDQGIFLRLYAAQVFNPQTAPIQDLIFIDGANPRERFKRFYLRSDGALPEELHYHLPGGANLRGYVNQPLFGDQVVALNIELRKRVRPPLINKQIQKYLGNTTLAVFADLAAMQFLDSKNHVLADAGLGLRFSKRLPDTWYTLFTGGRNLTLRLDFPVWVNEPLPGEKRLRFRWVFGFEQAI
ncbi:MAG: M1 family aminopeptidase [bacterium]